MTSEFRIDGDSHLEDPSDDRIGFQSMARRISQVLVSERSDTGIVIGLVGAWGSGKTSLMKFASRGLEESGAVTVWFNPWYYKGSEALVGNFFHEFAAQLDEKTLGKASIKLRKAVKQYSSLFWLTSVAGSAMAAQASKLKTDSSIEELKSEIEALLAESGKRIVVFIDDIDRLDEDELWDTLRLVKLCGGFRHLSFVLAYDRRYIEAIIAARYHRLPDSASYLEKIVQLPIQMPEIPRPALERSLVDELQDVVESARSTVETTYTDEDGERLWIGLRPLLGFEIATVRDTKRFGNSVKAMFDLTAGEVNVTDFILVQALRVHFPVLADALRNQRLEVLAGTRLKDPSGDPLALGRANDLVHALFPMINSTDESEVWTQAETRERHKRVCHPRYVHRYFFHGTPAGEVADSVIRDSLEALRNDDPKPLLDACVEGAGSVLRGLNGLSRDLDRDTAARLMVFLVREANTLSLSTDRGEDLGATAATVLANLLARFKYEEATRLAAETVKMASLTVSQDLMKQLDEAEFLDWEQAAEVLFRRLSRIHENPLHDPRTMDLIWNVIAKTKTRDEFTAWIKPRLDRAGLASLLSVMTFRGFTVSEYQALSKRVDPVVVAGSIQEHVGEPNFSEYWIMEGRHFTVEELCGSFLKRHADETRKSAKMKDAT